MLLLLAFKVTVFAILQIFILGFSGYILAKKGFISLDNLKFLSKLVINLLFPCFIFTKLISNFSFSSYPNWWIFPLLSFFVALVGFLTGQLFANIVKGLDKFRREFVSLITFQNSGYLPLILVALLLPAETKEQMFIYLFLFLLGFNAVMWSIGLFYLTGEGKKFEIKSLFSPPVIAILSALFAIAVGFNRIVHYLPFEPFKMFGECALPLAIMVVGGNLANIGVSKKGDFRYIFNVVTAKLLFLPVFFLGLIFLVKPPYEIAFLLLLQSAMPSAVSSSMIMLKYDKEDNIISLGVFWTHLVCMVTLPLFLALFSAFSILIYK
jgi:predicted permease